MNSKRIARMCAGAIAPAILMLAACGGGGPEETKTDASAPGAANAPAAASAPKTSAEAAKGLPGPPPPSSPGAARVMLGLKGTSGMASVVEAFEQRQGYPWTNENPKLLAFSRKSDGVKGKGVKWKTAPWSGKSADVLLIPTSFEGANLKVELSANGKSLLDFSPLDTDGPQSWEKNGAKLEFHKVGVFQGVHGVFGLTLPDGFSPADQPIELSIKITGADNEQSWFGVRDAVNGKDF
ncbi:hypothetical protein HYR69_12085 [Candidatus Sumerlaeota bacterium]|nr:hypothetical protein [Candidatus Sumerlaeota bacterium]MBI3736868.1 hypothetical protein [Candidatus Sumerlaeota bacterium]